MPTPSIFAEILAFHINELLGGQQTAAADADEGNLFRNKEVSKKKQGVIGKLKTKFETMFSNDLVNLSDAAIKDKLFEEIESAQCSIDAITSMPGKTELTLHKIKNLIRVVYTPLEDFNKKLPPQSAARKPFEIFAKHAMKVIGKKIMDIMNSERPNKNWDLKIRLIRERFSQILTTVAKIDDSNVAANHIRDKVIALINAESDPKDKEKDGVRDEDVVSIMRQAEGALNAMLKSADKPRLGSRTASVPATNRVSPENEARRSSGNASSAANSASLGNPAPQTAPSSKQSIFAATLKKPIEDLLQAQINRATELNKKETDQSYIGMATRAAKQILGFARDVPTSEKKIAILQALKENLKVALDGDNSDEVIKTNLNKEIEKVWYELHEVTYIPGSTELTLRELSDLIRISYGYSSDLYKKIPYTRAPERAVLLQELLDIVVTQLMTYLITIYIEIKDVERQSLFGWCLGQINPFKLNLDAQIEKVGDLLKDVKVAIGTCQNGDAAFDLIAGKFSVVKSEDSRLKICMNTVMDNLQAHLSPKKEQRKPGDAAEATDRKDDKDKENNSQKNEPGKPGNAAGNSLNDNQDGKEANLETIQNELQKALESSDENENDPKDLENTGKAKTESLTHGSAPGTNLMALFKTTSAAPPLASTLGQSPKPPI